MTTQANVKTYGYLLLATETFNSATDIAETLAHEYDHDEWLDDETHWVWTVAMDLYIEKYGEAVSS